MKKIIILIVILSTTFILSACLSFSQHPLEDGRYEIQRITIGDHAVARSHNAWQAFSSMTIDIDGRNFTFDNAGLDEPITGQWRVMNGFFEQRNSSTGNLWVRENGTAASGYMSTRVSEGYIVFTSYEGSEIARIFRDEVRVYLGISTSNIAEYLVGQWRLISHQYNDVVILPGDDEWIFNYRLEFDGNSFVKNEFWRHYSIANENNDWTSQGYWSVEGRNTLRLIQINFNGYAMFDFVSIKTVVSVNQTTLVLSYQRVIGDQFFVYTDTFIRVG